MTSRGQEPHGVAGPTSLSPSRGAILHCGPAHRPLAMPAPPTLALNPQALGGEGVGFGPLCWGQSQGLSVWDP